MEDIMNYFRNNCLEYLFGHKILAVSDYKKSMINYSSGCVEAINLPSSDVLKFSLEGNWSVVIRPSGTEPKLKMYYSISASNRKLAVELERAFVKKVEERIILN